jgi:hypothetical protein
MIGREEVRRRDLHEQVGHGCRGHGVALIIGKCCRCRAQLRSGQLLDAGAVALERSIAG